jgi:hypothetical protein
MFQYGDVLWIDGGPLRAKVLCDNGDEYSTVLISVVISGWGDEIRYIERNRLSRYRKGTDHVVSSEG